MSLPFAINHISAPGLSLDDFLAMTRRLGLSRVELRNDLPDIVGTVPAPDVRRAAEAAGIEILSINALYPFNVWSGDLPDRAVALADYARDCGAKALVMCPLNDGTPVPLEDTTEALRRMAPILRERGLAGLVEPLGFPISSLRLKADAVKAIQAAGAEDVYRLMHDTFHHHLAGETEVFPQMTGLVHISGVTDEGVDVAEMLDPHRVLVDAADRLGNIPQLRQLIDAGYTGPVSFEPFAPEVHALDDAESALRGSMAHVLDGLGESRTVPAG